MGKARSQLPFIVESAAKGTALIQNWRDRGKKSVSTTTVVSKASYERAKLSLITLC